MKAKTVYRVQDSEGRGPWRPGFSMQWTEDRPPEEYAKLKPIYAECPDLLQQLTPGLHVGVGCQTVDQLKRWITETEFATLYRLGFRCFKFEADNIVYASDIQCVFEMKKPLRKCGKRIRFY